MADIALILKSFRPWPSAGFALRNGQGPEPQQIWAVVSKGLWRNPARRETARGVHLRTGARAPNGHRRSGLAV